MSAPIAARPVAAIVGGTRGIGLAMGREWLKRHRYQSPKLFLLGRRVKDNSAISEMKTEFDDCHIDPVYVDLIDESSIARAAKEVSFQATSGVDYLFHTAGVLHNFDTAGKQKPNYPVLPERSLRGLTFEGMQQTFLLNAIAPALVMKEFSALLKLASRNGYRTQEEQKPPVAVALSARVGSISDNGKGGWTSYRASKAALNMVMMNCHHEFSMGGKQKAIFMSLHPGTVDTGLSKPFQAAAKRQYNIFTPEESARMLVGLCEESDASWSGNFFDYSGKKILW